MMFFEIETPEVDLHTLWLYTSGAVWVIYTVLPVDELRELFWANKKHQEVPHTYLLWQ